MRTCLGTANQARHSDAFVSASLRQSHRCASALCGSAVVKYKNIYSAIHNFGHSFTSLMNYVDGGYVIDELEDIHCQGCDIEIDWFTRRFEPESLASSRIKKSIGYWGDSLPKHMASHNVELEKISSLKFLWPAGERKTMLAVDDREREYKIYVNEIG